MGAQRKDLKLSKVYRKNKKCFSTGKKNSLKIDMVL